LVIKKDGKRERFNRDKLRLGLQKSCEKTEITAAQIEDIIARVEQELRQKDLSETESTVIGGLVAEELRKIDKVAYIRFASVFKRFAELADFKKEIATM
jgi:transcriptional repressor NrdR